MTVCVDSVFRCDSGPPCTQVAGLTAAPGALGLMSGTVLAASEEKRDTALKTDEVPRITQWSGPQGAF